MGAGRTCEVTLQGEPAPRKATAQPCKLLGLRVRTELLGSGKQWGSLKMQSACSGHSSEIAPVDTLHQHINACGASQQNHGDSFVWLQHPLVSWWCYRGVTTGHVTCTPSGKSIPGRRECDADSGERHALSAVGCSHNPPEVCGKLAGKHQQKGGHAGEDMKPPEWRAVSQESPREDLGPGGGTLGPDNYRHKTPLTSLP